MTDNKMPSYITLPSIGNAGLGFITIAEANINIPFVIKRVYWTYFTPNNVIRGGHAHKNLEQVIFAVSGTIKFNFENLNSEKEVFTLDNPNVGVHIPKMVWREIQFSHNAVLLCLASDHYDEEDYIRNYENFITYKQ